MMTIKERQAALLHMEGAIRRFYTDALRIGNHPFVEFAAVMTTYLKACQRAAPELDFTETGNETPLPLEPYEIEYLADKLNSIFSGRIEVRKPVGNVAAEGEI